MPDEQKEPDSERSMRLLQPKLTILYLISTRGKVSYNISEISRTLGYVKDSWINNLIHTLLDDKYIQTSVEGESEYLTLTKKGRRKIAPLVFFRYSPYLIALFATVFVVWGVQGTLFGLIITPLDLFVSASLLLVLAAYLVGVTRSLEAEYFKTE